MSSKKSITTVPSTYQGREQAFIKHLLLKSYLEKLFMIVGMSARKLRIREFCYVDCFAGPWSDESEGMGGTSIAISLQILDRCRQALEHRGVTLDFRALYVEKNPIAFARLKQYVANKTPAGIEACALQGDFVSLREKILNWCGTGPFVFFFIDPTGWKEVGIDVLGQLLQRARSEFLINFMYNDINRTASMSEWKEDIAALLGETVVPGDRTPAEREMLLLNTYRKNLKRQLNTDGKWPARSAYVRILDREKERPKYHLVYLTSHPRGIIEFMEISEKLEYIQKRVRASTKQSARAEKSGMDDMFANELYVKPEDGHVIQGEVEQYWLNHLTGEAKQIGEEEFANLIEATDWFPGDFQRALFGLITAGKVRNLDAPKKRPKQPLHWKDGDRLQLMEKNK